MMNLQLHAIQLKSVQVLSLRIDTKAWPEREDGESKAESNVALAVAHSGYDAEQKRISVRMKAETPEDVPGPYSLRIEIIGFFDVDESAFPIEQIDHWAQHNAPFILVPYLREHIYSLTERVGHRPAILPLLQVPIFTQADQPVEEPKAELSHSSRRT